MEGTVRIGFVGVGGMGQAAHLRNYVNVPGCQVTALAELRPKLARGVARKYGVLNVYRSAQEMLANEALDAIVASQPFTHHGAIITPLYKSHIPVFTEKPIAAREDVAEKMLAALKEGGSWHMVGYHKRSDPATMYAKKEIDRLKQTGELGALKYIRITMPAGDWVASGFSDNINTDDQYQWTEPDVPNNPAEEPFIQFVNYYIHQVNLVRHLLGEPYRVTYADPSGVVLVGQSQSGITCTIEMSPYHTTIDWQESTLVAFERGWVKLTLPAPLAYNRPGSVEVYADPGGPKTPILTTPTLPWVHAMRQQAINFVRAVKGEIKPICEADEALEDLKIARQYMSLKGS